MKDHTLRLLTLMLLLAAGTSHAETRALIAAGLGGNADYDEEFQRHAGRLADGLADVSDDVTLLTGEDAGTAGIRDALSGMTGRLTGKDVLLFVFVGHGTWDGERFRFNVTGRDFTAEDLRDWLDAAPADHQIVIVTGASSGAAQDVLADEKRTVITATRSGEQRNATVFGRFFTAALKEDEADLDKDQRITALEAYRYAEARITRFYEGEGEMTTENPVQSGPDPVLVLALLDDAPPSDPLLDPLLEEREALELDIAFLRENKDDYSVDDYYAALQALLLELATIEAQIESREYEEELDP
jgi:hypothetical protein